MSYYNININALDNMITEYKNLRDSLEKCGGVLSKSVVGLSVDVYAGMDADILRTAWGIQSTDTIPNIGELLNGVISILEDSLNEYKECKCYCDNMINVFEDYSDVCCSPDSMSGDVMCDTDRIEAAVEAETNIGDEKCEIAEDIASAIRMVEGLNYSQNGILMALEALAEENSKYNQYSYHLFQLKMYRQKMVEADDHLRDKLAGLNSCLDVGLNEEFVPEGKALEGYSPEVIQAAMILAKGNPTKEEIERFYSIYSEDKKFTKEDYILFMNAIGNTDSEIWNSLQAQVMAEAYKYGVNIEDCELLTLFFGYAAIKDETVHFSSSKNACKLDRVLAYIDPHEDGVAYFTAVACTNIPEEQQGVNAYISVKLVDGDLILEYSGSGYESTQYIKFVDMFVAIPDDAYENMHMGWGMSDEEIVAFLSCIYTEEDIAKVCELSSIKQGNIDQYVEFFSGDTSGISPAFSPALADFTYHLGEYGTDEFGQELLKVSNSILSVGTTESYLVKDNAYFYFDTLTKGYKVRFDQTNLITAVFFNKPNYDNFCYYGTLSTFFESEKYIYQNAVNYSTFNGYLIEGSLINQKVDYKNIQFTDISFENNCIIDYRFEYDFVYPGITEHESYPIQVFGDYCDGSYANDKSIQVMCDVKWDRSVYPIKTVYNVGKKIVGFSEINTFGAFDVMDNLVDGKIGISKDTGIPKSVAYMTQSFDVAYGLSQECSSFDDKMKAAYNEYFDDKTGWKTGFTVGGNFNPNGNVSLDSPQKYFVVISEPYSPQGYIIKEEIANGFFTDDLSESEKKDLSYEIESSYVIDESQKQYVQQLLFGGFDQDSYLKEHSVDELTDVYDKAFDIYDLCFKETVGIEKNQLLQDKIDEREKEIYQEYYY